EKSLNMGPHKPRGEGFRAAIPGFEIRLLYGRPIKIDVPSKKTASKFERSGEALAARRIIRIIDGAVCVRRQQAPRLVSRKTSSDKCALILRLNCREVFLRCRIDACCFGIIKHVAQAETVE